jgi:Kelch motif protein/galactose oxidase-like protein
MGVRRFLVPAVFGVLGCSSSSSPPAPAHDSWQSLPPEPLARFESYAASDGTRIWFLGGITGTLGNLASAAPSRRVDVYDPASGTWTEGPDLPADSPKHHLAVAVVGGSVYVLGGFDGILGQTQGEPFTPIAKAYVNDSGGWRALADPPLARGASTAQAIGTKIYLTGGAPTEDVAPYDELDIYDTATDSWSKGAPMPTAREHLASCAIGGKFIVVGGWAGQGSIVTSAAEVYDPATDTWTKIPDLPTARGGLEANDYGGVCHVVGGENFALPLPGTFSTHDGWDTNTSSWTTFAPMPTARHGFGFARQSGVFYAIGGGPIAGNSYTDVVEEYVP